MARWILSDSTHIVDKNLKLVMGLIWALILHYNLAQPTGTSGSSSPTAPRISPKQRLLAWIQSKLPEGVRVTVILLHLLHVIISLFSRISPATGTTVSYLAPSWTPVWPETLASGVTGARRTLWRTPRRHLRWAKRASELLG